VKAFAGELAASPRYVTTAASGEGFRELMAFVLAAREAGGPGRS